MKIFRKKTFTLDLKSITKVPWISVKVEMTKEKKDFMQKKFLKMLFL